MTRSLYPSLIYYIPKSSTGFRPNYDLHPFTEVIQCVYADAKNLVVHVVGLKEEEEKTSNYINQYY